MCFFKEARAIKKAQQLEAATQWINDRDSVFEMLKQLENEYSITMSTSSPYMLVLKNPETGTTTQIGGHVKEVFWSEAKERLYAMINLQLMSGYKS